MSRDLVFLKLGGSLITDKNQPHTPRQDVLDRLAHEIADAQAQNPEIRILLGHGSGSFGHFPASVHKTRLGVRSLEDWRGFAEVWQQAAELNHIVIQALEKAHLPALPFSPSARVIARHGKVATWNLDTLLQALRDGMLPVIHGDVVFDTGQGGTILSTEDLFAYLAGQLTPACILLAGIEPGVWADFPRNTKLLPEITPASLKLIEAGLSGSAATDVTGGMEDKVRQLIPLVSAHPGLVALIFSGETPGNVRRALLGENLGTLVHA